MSQLWGVRPSLTSSQLLSQRVKPKPADMWRVDFDVGQVLNCHWQIRCSIQEDFSKMAQHCVLAFNRHDQVLTKYREYPEKY